MVVAGYDPGPEEWIWGIGVVLDALQLEYELEANG
jgi:hypothetical protein